jgi:hypothetical protein
MKYAILIDAGFLKRKLGSQVEPLNVNGVCTFLDALRAHEVLAGMSLHRVYWYDAPPLDTRVTKPSVTLTALDLEPNIHQKGADMLEHSDLVLDVPA